MAERNDLKSIIAGLVIIIGGVVAILIDLFWLKTDRSIWISIGCSLLASGIVILAQVLLIEDRKENPLEKWGLEKIYETRAEKNQESDPELDKAKVQIDAVAFGLKVSAKYSCGFSNPQISPIIAADRYLDYFTTIMEDRLWQVLARPAFRWWNRSDLSMNAVRAA